MARDEIPLDDGWQFGQVPACSFQQSDVDDRAEVEEWLPATVPGNVRTDLLALDRIPRYRFITKITSRACGLKTLIGGIGAP